MFGAGVTLLAVMVDHPLDFVQVVAGGIGSSIGVLVAFGLGFLVRSIGKPLVGTGEASDDVAPGASSSLLSGIIPKLPWYDYLWAGTIAGFWLLFMKVSSLSRYLTRYSHSF